MSESQVQDIDRETQRRLEQDYPGTQIRIQPVFAGFTSNSSAVPFLYHAVNVQLPDSRENVTFTRPRLHDSLRLVELELSSRAFGDEIHFATELLTS